MRRDIRSRLGGAVLLAFGLSSAAMGQAFGVGMGVPLGTLATEATVGDGIYEVEVPNPHPEFESYVVKATDETGVCLVRGIGKSHENDRFGDSVRMAFDELKQALLSRYGNAYSGDYLRPGALWDEPNEWVMAVLQNERVFEAVWDKEEGSTLPEGVSDIILRVRATNSDAAWIALQYRFANEDACSAAIEKVSQSGL